MLNQLVLVGRLVEDPMLYKNDDKNYFEIVLAVPKTYKNQDGQYETDNITCRLRNTVGGSVAEYCHKGDLLGIKARVEAPDGNIVIVADKVTFLTSKRADE